MLNFFAVPITDEWGTTYQLTTAGYTALVLIMLALLLLACFIGNSIKYMDKEKGVIDIRLLDEVDSIRVEIEDNGKGIAAKDLANIFERFYRTDASRNSTKGGSGIGLSIVKKIIEDHGGYIWATSKEGEGTCLHFVIRKYREAEGHEQDIDH